MVVTPHVDRQTILDGTRRKAVDGDGYVAAVQTRLSEVATDCSENGNERCWIAQGIRNKDRLNTLAYIWLLLL